MGTSDCIALRGLALTARHGGLKGRVQATDAGSDIVLCMTQVNLWARAYHRTLRVKLARTIADLAGCEEIGSVHLAEALQYRPKLMLS